MGMRLWLVSLGVVPMLLVGSGPGAVASTPVLPPENGLIALSTSEGIRLVDAQRGTSWTVPGTADMGSPVWSPDGKLIAAEGWDDDQTSVYTIRPDGSERQLVLQDAYSPSWSPDGKQLVVTLSGGNVSVLAIVDADGGEARQITFDHGGDNDGAGEPAWSPDGRWIAFTQGDGAVRLVTPNGEADGVKTIAQEGMNPAWSPDGSKLAFDSADPVTYEQSIAVLDVRTGKRSELRPRKLVSAAAWSPDGAQLAFLATRPMPKTMTSHGCGGEMPSDLWTTRLDGGKANLVEKNVYGQPSWGTFEPESKTTD
jgi:Tol biopolymer transport system component